MPGSHPTGPHPVEAVCWLDRIARTAEAMTHFPQLAAHAYISGTYHRPQPPSTQALGADSDPAPPEEPASPQSIQLPDPSTLPRAVHQRLAQSPVVPAGPTQLVLMLSGKR